MNNLQIGKLHQINYAIPLYKEKAELFTQFFYYLKDLDIVTILDIIEDSTGPVSRIRILTDKGDVGWVIITLNTILYSIRRI